MQTVSGDVGGIYSYSLAMFLLAREMLVMCKHGLSKPHFGAKRE